MLLSKFGKLAAGAKSQDFPSPVVEKAKAHLLDTVGLLLSACRHPAVEQARRYLLSSEDRHIDSEGLAFLGAVACDAQGLDDFDEATRIHPGCVVIPALLAVARGGVKPPDFLAAVISGYETTCRLGRLLDAQSLHQRGFHPTAVVGALGAAAAVARLQRKGSRETAVAMGLAASLASGLFELDPEGRIKGMQAGFAAANGIRSNHLQRAGYRCSPSVVEGAHGMLQMLGAGERETSGALQDVSQRAEADGLFRPDSLLQHISFKPYPHFSDLHPATFALLKLAGEHQITAGQVKAIQLRISEKAAARLNREFPPHSLHQARRCPRFSLASALFHFHAEKPLNPLLRAFERAALENPQILALAEKIIWETKPREEPSESAEVVVRLHSGDRFEGSAGSYPGDGRNPDFAWGLQQIKGRFRELLSDRDAGQVNRWTACVDHLEVEDGHDFEPMIESLWESLLLPSPLRLLAPWRLGGLNSPEKGR